MAEFIQVFTTVDKRDTAQMISKELLNSRLVACVQVIGPVFSSYWWKGRVRRSREWMCLTKAKISDYKRIEERIKQIHPYETPEILATPILKGNADYLTWIRGETIGRTGKNRSS